MSENHDFSATVERLRQQLESLIIDTNDHLDGIPWHEAAIPFPIHKCWAQTTGWVGFTKVERCACGGMRTNRGGLPYWHDKNQRRGKFISALSVGVL